MTEGTVMTSERSAELRLLGTGSVTGDIGRHLFRKTEIIGVKFVRFIGFTHVYLQYRYMG